MDRRPSTSERLYDFALSAKDIIIPAQGKAIVPTDIAIAVPEGYYGRVGKSRLVVGSCEECRCALLRIRLIPSISKSTNV